MSTHQRACSILLLLALLPLGVSAATAHTVTLPTTALITPSPPPDWSVLGGQAGARMGRAATSAGDVNGDGYDDLLVGSEWYDNGEIDEGRVCVFLGSAAGLTTQPAWCAESNVAGAHFGYSASTAGDVNGDGYDDVIVGAPWYTEGQASEGCAFLYLGSPDGLAAEPVWTWQSDQDGAHFGIVSTAGDVNNDGFNDVVIGAPHYDGGEVDEGKAWLFLGSAEGLGAEPDWTAELNQAGAQFGASVATAGDVNGDGYDDVIISALWYYNGQYAEGGAFLYLGSAQGLAPVPAWTAESDQAGAEFGTYVATAGDVNADGYDDVVVGARYYDQGQTDEGAAFVYLGSAGGLASEYAWMAVGNQASATFGMFVSTAGDVDGDGYGDLIISAPSYDAGETNEGRVYLYKGSAAGLPTMPDWIAEGNQDSALFGYSGHSHAGDVNGDGYADIAIGALWFDGSLVDEGAVFVYYGGPASGTAVTLTSLTALTDRTGVNMEKWLVPAVLAVVLAIVIASRRRASHSRDVRAAD